MILKEEEALEPPSKKAGNSPRDSREFARRMIMSGIMSLETVSRLSGLSLTAVQELATRIALNSQK